ncbi:MAG: sugar ABC transporter ATP-binding protein [Methylobacteriaceae bacterium]|jgi:erythritol transport system ATP-binding protein|nr:sugar ABC transporter ATP-binding protein [Methylobacteriaceae bacterium]
MSDVIIETAELSKVYPGTIALNKVNFKVRRGKVNVLIGENGAGKSTMMKILAGAETSSSGEIFVEGRKVEVSDVRAAERLGIGIIFQELNLFPNLTVSENIFAGNEITRRGSLQTRKEIDAARALLKRLGISIDPTMKLGDLYVGQQQLVEIAKALSKDVKVLIMDEPTSALSKSEVEILFKIIRDLKEQGITIIYISHRLEEIMTIGDNITILRNGFLVAEDEVANIDIPWIIRNMVGSDKKRFAYSDHALGEEVLTVKDVSLKRSNGTLALDHVSFSIRAGEIVGIYGLMGGGRTELMECILGAHPMATGDILLDNRSIMHMDIADRIRLGVSLVPENRQKEGLISLMSIVENATISSLWRFAVPLPLFNNLAPLRHKVEAEHVGDIVGRLGIKVGSIRDAITSLSGGNMQKVVIGKALLTMPKVLLMDEPTRGIDVGAKEDVYKAMDMLASSGIAIIYTTSELDEATAVSNRLMVLASGHLRAVMDRANYDREAIVRASTPLAMVG